MDIEKLQKIIEVYGQKNQEQIAIEEMAELTQAICKNWRYHNDKTANNLREELADVKVMVAQLETIYGNVDDIVKYKIERQIKRLEQEADND